MPIQNSHLGIVAGVDGSPPSTAAVEWAARDAQLRNVPLRLVTVIAPVSVTSSSSWLGVPARADRARFRNDKTAARQMLELARRAADAAASPGRKPPAFIEVLIGAVVPTLADYAAHADMLVVGCQRRSGLSRALFGSVSAGLDHHAQCPLGVVHGDDSLMTRSPKAPVVVGIDGSSGSESAIEIAFDEASRRGVDLVALHTWNDEGPANFGRPAHAPIEWAEFQAHEEEVLGERLAGWGSRYPEVSVHKVVVADRPADRLIQLAEKAQLLVLGSHPRGRLAGALRRSVSSVVVTAARTPVIVAHEGH